MTVAISSASTITTATTGKTMILTSGEEGLPLGSGTVDEEGLPLGSRTVDEEGLPLGSGTVSTIKENRTLILYIEWERIQQLDLFENS